MLDLAVGIVGVSLLTVGLYDLVITTVAVSAGKGPVTAQVARAVWLAVLAVADRSRGRSTLSAGGALVLFAVIGTWVLLLVVGWSCLLYAVGGAVTDAGVTLGFRGMLRFVATSVVGGDPPDASLTGAWTNLQPLLIGSGFVLLSLVIAYVIPVLNATVRKRRVASYISTLGHDPEQIIARSWNGQDLDDLHLHLIALAPMITDVAEAHLAYPVLHYMDSRQRHTALCASVATLDETLTLLELLDRELGVGPSALLPVRRAISELLNTLREAFIHPADEPPPQAPFDDVRRLELGLPDDERLGHALEALDDRRQLLHAFMRHMAWDWQDLTTSQLRVTEHPTTEPLQTSSPRHHP